MHPLNTPNGCPDNTTFRDRACVALRCVRTVVCGGWGHVTFGFKGAAYVHTLPPQGAEPHPVTGAFVYV